MESLLKYLVETTPNGNTRDNYLNCYQKVNFFKTAFKMFLLGDQANLGLSKHSIGTFLSIGAAAFNLYKIRQSVIKHSIYITRSKNPLVVKLV